MDQTRQTVDEIVKKLVRGYAPLNRVSHSAPDLYSPFIDLCEKATRYYLEERYPPGPPAEYTRLEIKHDLDSARELVAAIRERAGL